MNERLALWLLDPESVRAEVRAALAAHDGNVTHAAAALGIPRRTMDRWLERTGLREYGAELRARWLAANFPRD